MKRIKTGKIISTKMDKTVVVLVSTYKLHPKYKKRYKISKKFYAHDEMNEGKEGDNVKIEEIRPLSKTKRWKIVKSKNNDLEKTSKIEK